MNLLQSLSPDGRQLAKAEKLAKKLKPWAANIRRCPTLICRPRPNSSEIV